MKSPQAVFALLIALVPYTVAATVAHGQQTLYAITNAGQLYSVDPLTGVATAKMPGPTVPGVSAIGLGFYTGFAITFDNNIGGFRLLNPATGQNVGTPIFVAGLGPLGGDGDFCFASNGTGYIADGGFVPSIRSFNLTTLTAAPLPTIGPFTGFRGLAADAVDPNKLYAMDNTGSIYTITNVTAGVANVTKITAAPTPLAGFSFGGLAMTTANNLFCVDNSNSSSFVWPPVNNNNFPTSLRQVNPANGFMGGNLNMIVTTITGVTFGGGIAPLPPGPPLPPPPPPPGGGGAPRFNGEGAYSSFGGFFGFGGGGQQLAPNPILAGPVRLNPEGDVLVCNFARVSAAEPSGNSAAGVVGGALLVTACGAGLVLAGRRWGY